MGYRAFEYYHLKRLTYEVYDYLAEGVKNIQNEFSISSVLDVGCSCGAMLNKIDCKDKAGLDFDIPQKAIDNIQGRYIDHNLNTDPIFIKHFSLIICQEVAEHILPENENKVLGLIDLNSTDNTILIFCGAVPGQPGRGHYNCRKVKYWKKKLKDFGFYYNRRLTRAYRSPIPRRSIYNKHTLVYLKKEKI